MVSPPLENFQPSPSALQTSQHLQMLLLKNEARYFIYRRIKKWPLQHQTAQSWQQEPQASAGLVFPQGENHTLENALVSLCS